MKKVLNNCLLSNFISKKNQTLRISFPVKISNFFEKNFSNNNWKIIQFQPNKYMIIDVIGTFLNQKMGLEK